VRRAWLPVAVLVLVAAAYPVVAFQTPPGFFEGFCPPVDYKWLKPPPQVRATATPGSGHAVIKTMRDSSGNQIVGPGFVATADDNPQAQLSFVPNAFQLPAGGAGEVIDIKPVADYPPAPGISVVTNVYLITSSTPMTKPSNLRLLYSTVLPAPSSIYVAQQGGSWQAMPSSASTSTGCSDISSQVSSTGYFMAGYLSGSTSSGGGAKVGGGQLLPIVVALAILIVVLAGVPLAILRRRQLAAEEEPEEPPKAKRRRPRRRT
jgi:hypothetical protein